MKEAYSIRPLPRLGKSDHNLLNLKPDYKPVDPQQTVTTRSVRRLGGSKRLENSLG